ncbi:MAG: hypothetical protein IT462_16890 [Planctomycetes bacterium]|nr:hypothetical protein [Planctomycetota bacterium]
MPDSDEESLEPKLPLKLDDPISNAEMLIDFPALQAYYREKKIQCLLCDAAMAETFAQGAKVHGGGKWGAFDAEQVVRDLNELAKRHPFRKESVPDLSLIGRLKSWLFKPKTSPS